MKDVVRVIDQPVVALGEVTVPEDSPNAPVAYVDPRVLEESVDDGNEVLVDDRPFDMSQEDLREFASVLLEDDSADVFDALSAALAAEKVDVIVRRVRNRTHVVSLLEKLANAVYMITSVADMLGIEENGVRIVGDKDFSRYTKERLANITALVRSRIVSFVAENQRILEDGKALASAKQAAEAALEKTKKDVAETVARYDARIDEMRESLVSANSMLASIVEVDRFVVAKVDPESHEIETYLNITDGKVRGATSHTMATPFETFAEANSWRIRVIKARCSVISKNVNPESWKQTLRGKALRDDVKRRYVVMRVGLRPVKFGEMV